MQSLMGISSMCQTQEVVLPDPKGFSRLVGHITYELPRSDLTCINLLSNKDIWAWQLSYAPINVALVSVFGMLGRVRSHQKQ